MVNLRWRICNRISCNSDRLQEGCVYLGDILEISWGYRGISAWVKWPELPKGAKVKRPERPPAGGQGLGSRMTIKFNIMLSLKLH